MKALITVVLLSISIPCFSQEPVTYEYLTMVQVSNEIMLSKNSQSFEILKVKEEMTRSSYDYSPLLKRIQNYEEQGWEFVSSNIYVTIAGSHPSNYVLMRRKK